VVATNNTGNAATSANIASAAIKAREGVRRQNRSRRKIAGNVPAASRTGSDASRTKRSASMALSRFACTSTPASVPAPDTS
jgi:hypothetical protein